MMIIIGVICAVLLIIIFGMKFFSNKIEKEFCQNRFERNQFLTSNQCLTDNPKKSQNFDGTYYE